MRKFLAVTFFVAVSLLIVACGNSEPSNVSKPAESSPQSSGSSSAAANTSDTVPDLPAKHFARTSVLYVVKNEIMLPYGDGTFRGDKPVTNYEFAMALAKILDDTYTGTIEVRSMPFTDVPPQHWAYENVLKLAYAGVVEGYGDGTFRGDNPRTRYEAAQLLAKLHSFLKKANG